MARATAPRVDLEVYERAKVEARRLHRPVYLVGDEILHDRPTKTAAMIWPNGSVTWGNPQAASKQIDRRHMPPAA